VHYYTMNESGGGSWHAAATWPVPGERTERLYLSAGRQLQRRPPPREADNTFTVGTEVDCPQGGVGPFMQPCLHAGQGLSVTSEPLDHDHLVTGNPVIGLRLRVDRPDANVFAYLTDVGPDGEASVITEGRLKASLRAEAPAPFAVPATPWHRAYAQDVQPLHAGEAVTLHFEFLPTAYRIAAGHRVGITLMGADYRERLRDPSVAGTAITVLSSAAEPSWLELPLLP